MLSDWEQLKKSHPIGAKVRGYVLRREPFGVWVDAGLGFPTLLEVIFFSNCEQRLELDDYPVPGSTIEATILGFREQSHQVYLTQQPLRT